MPPTLKSRLGSTVAVRLPSEHLGLVWRPATTDDLDDVMALVEKTERLSQAVRRTPAHEIETLVHPALPETHVTSIVGSDSVGDIQAFAAVRADDDQELARAELFAVTDQHWRGRGIGRALLTWQQAVARRMLLDMYGPDSQLPVRILNVVDEHLTDRRLLYVAAGFSCKSDLDVYFSDLNVDARLTIPKGQHLQSWADSDLDKVKELYIKTVRFHGSTTTEANKWWDRIHRLINTDLSFSVVDEDGDLVAAAATCPHSDLWQSSGEIDAVIDLVALRSYDDVASLEALISHISALAHNRGFTGLSIETNLRATTSVDVRLLRLGYHRIGTRKLYAIDM